MFRTREYPFSIMEFKYIKPIVHVLLKPTWAILGVFGFSILELFEYNTYMYFN